jgi:hypothetical protein
MWLKLKFQGELFLQAKLVPGSNNVTMTSLLHFRVVLSGMTIQQPAVPNL